MLPLEEEEPLERVEVEVEPVERVEEELELLVRVEELLLERAGVVPDVRCTVVVRPLTSVCLTVVREAPLLLTRVETVVEG